MPFDRGWGWTLPGMRAAGGGGPYGGNRGHPRLTVAVIIIVAGVRALREAPLRGYRQRLPCSRSVGVLQRRWGGQSRPPLRRDDAVCRSTICGGCRYRGAGRRGRRALRMVVAVCRSTGVGGGRYRACGPPGAAAPTGVIADIRV